MPFYGHKWRLAYNWLCRNENIVSQCVRKMLCSFVFWADNCKSQYIFRTFILCTVHCPLTPTVLTHCSYTEKYEIIQKVFNIAMWYVVRGTCAFASNMYKNQHACTKWCAHGHFLSSALHPASVCVHNKTFIRLFVCSKIVPCFSFRFFVLQFCHIAPFRRFFIFGSLFSVRLFLLHIKLFYT